MGSFGVSPGPGDVRTNTLGSEGLSSSALWESRQTPPACCFCTNLLVMELGEGVAGETAPPGLAVQHQGQVMLLLGG